MRALVQRVTEASVTVAGEQVGAIGPGLLCLVGAVDDDGAEDAAFIERKILSLRIFPDESARMNKSVIELGGSLLVVSQFTLCADIGKGARPSFVRAMAPERAAPFIADMVGRLRTHVPVEIGRFGADMKVALINDGPVTIWIDSRCRERS